MCITALRRLDFSPPRLTLPRIPTPHRAQYRLIGGGAPYRRSAEGLSIHLDRNSAPMRRATTHALDTLPDLVAAAVDLLGYLLLRDRYC